MSVSIQSRVESLIEALPYIQQFRGKLFVIKYGGSAMEDDAVVDRLLRDIVFLEAVGINPVVIHGGGKAISQRMRDAGQKPRFVNGLRVTDAEAISIVESVLDGVINADIAARIELSSPPVVREDTPQKFSFLVASLAEAAQTAAAVGGSFPPPDAAWSWRGMRHLDGHDPEGNVVQLRELARGA